MYVNKQHHISNEPPTIFSQVRLNVKLSELPSFSSKFAHFRNVKIRLTKKKSESHLKKEGVKLTSAHTLSGSFSLSGGLSKQQTINPLTYDFFATKTCAVLPPKP